MTDDEDLEVVEAAEDDELELEEPLEVIAGPGVTGGLRTVEANPSVEEGLKKDDDTVEAGARMGLVNERTLAGIETPELVCDDADDGKGDDDAKPPATVGADEDCGDDDADEDCGDDDARAPIVNGSKLPGLELWRFAAALRNPMSPRPLLGGSPLGNLPLILSIVDCDIPYRSLPYHNVYYTIPLKCALSASLSN